MASWVRRGDRNQVHVSYFKDGTPHRIPRKQTRHLDHENDTNVQYWVDVWASHNEDPRLSYTKVVADTELQRLIDAFCLFLQGRKKNEGTISHHRTYLIRDVVPFFLESSLTSPVDWPTKSWALHDHLIAKSYSGDVIKYATTSLNLFWQWLGKDQIKVLATMSLPLLNPVVEHNDFSPSDRPVSPKEAIDFAQNHADPYIRMMTLIGYFFSLRPQEIMSLRRSDFIAGSQAGFTQAAKQMAGKGLFDRFVVNVWRQRRANGKYGGPKKGSKGIVACFNKEAAMIIANELKALGDEELIFDNCLPGWSFKKWAKQGYPGNTELKDMRRTSLYWLGHTAGLDFAHLKSHARHARSDTTMLYLRPAEERLDPQRNSVDLDA